MATALGVGSGFCMQGRESEKRHLVARRWVNTRMPELAMLHAMVTSSDRSTMSDFDVLAGSVPVAE